MHTRDEITGKLNELIRGQTKIIQKVEESHKEYSEKFVDKDGLEDLKAHAESILALTDYLIYGTLPNEVDAKDDWCIGGVLPWLRGETETLIVFTDSY